MTRDTLRVRPFLDSDQASVVALWSQVFPDDPPRNEPRAVIDRKLRVQRELFLVGEFVGDLVGTVIAGFDGYRGWVYHLAVHPDFRRRGFGRALMHEAEARLKALGCPKLNLQIRSSNAEVIAFYEQLGYSIEDRASLGKILD
jgi:ribosomal protein S18 acetylase RimI-like enzyme